MSSIYTILLNKIDFGPPPRSGAFFVLFLEFWDEIDVFVVLAISDQKSIFVDRYDEKSMFRKNVRFQVATSFEPVQSRTNFRLHIEPPNGVEKWPAAAQARVKLLLEI